MMMLIKKLKIALLGLAMLLPVSAFATPVFVGSWHVGDGEQWSSSIAAYSGQESAALLFGGVANDYVISTISDLVADIDFMAWYDGNTIGLDKLAQDFDNGDFYAVGVRSAYVLDNSCGNRYGNLNDVCTDQYVNFAFRVNAVPEPAPLALLGLGLLGLGLVRKRRA